MKKLGLVIADGVGYRNYVMSNFLKLALKEFDEVIIYSALIKDLYEDDIADNLKVIELDVFKENKIIWLFRKLKEVAHMKKHISFFGIKTSYNNGKPKNIKNITSFLNLWIYQITYIFHSEKNILFFEKFQYFLIKQTKTYSKYIEYLSNDKPNHLFFTHQRPYNLAPLLAASKELNIKTSSFIFSWDNLPSKGRMLGEFDNYMVWSKLMKEELKYFYPNTIKDNIRIVGTPQFEPYVMEEYESEVDFFYNKFHLDINKKTVYYSCGDISTSRLDPMYIEIIAKAINKNKIQDVNFIVRTSPAEDNSRFKKIIENYSNIKWNFPDWKLTRTDHTETWSQRVPTKNDIKDLRAILTYSDVNINMCSTMSLDSMIFDKPVVNTHFGNGLNGLYDDQKYLSYVHFKDVVDSDSVTITRNEEELIDAINQALLYPNKQSIKRKKILDIKIGKPLLGTSERIILDLKSL